MAEARNDRDAAKSSAISAIVLAVFAVLVAAYSMTYGLQTLVWIEARSWLASNPWLNDVPKPLPSPAATPARPPELPGRAAQTKPSRLQAYDYDFSVPWTGKYQAGMTRLGAEFRFDSGQVVVFFDPESQLDTLRALKSAAPAEYAKYQSVFAHEDIETNYALYRAVYGASAAQVSPFMAEAEARRMNVLLLWKLSFGFDMPGGIYSFNFGKNRGFQFGSPANGQPVAVRVFDDQDRQFRFLFTQTSRSNAQVTQDDINSIVQSLRLTPILER